MSGYINKNGIEVPRVNNILKYINDTESLCNWANYLGFKRKRYKDELNKYSRIGDYAHNVINLYINNKDINITSDSDIEVMSNNASSGFIAWWNDICKNNKVEVIKSEYSMVGDRYGGTLDALIKINDKLYLIDFKTSSNVRISHIIQLIAYKELLKEVEDIDNIDGLIVVKSSRDNYEVYEEFIINIDEKSNEFINKCKDVFESALILNTNLESCNEMFKYII